MKECKLVIIAASSGAGKASIVKYLLTRSLNLRIPVSTTTRKPRETEQNGKEYDFLTREEFTEKINRSEFLEWEEVYPGCFYGTLKSEVDHICENGQNILFDVDVVGGIKLKKYYGGKALAVFIQPPSIKELKNRPLSQSHNFERWINAKGTKTEQDLKFINLFDTIIINDKPENTFGEAKEKVSQYLNSGTDLK